MQTQGQDTLHADAKHRITGTSTPDWLDRFFSSYYRHRPVNATFIGVHDWDSLLPDFSDNGAGDALADMQDLLSRPDGTGASQSSSERLDRRLAEGFLKIQLWEFQSQHFHRGNPSLYTGEGVFAVMSLFLTEFGSLADRVEYAVERMQAIPRLLAQGRANIKRAPLAWTERAIRECEGGHAFFTCGIDSMIAENQIKDPRLRAAADKACSAFRAFQDYLDTDIRSRPSDHYACGDEAVDIYLKEGHFLEMKTDEIERYAKAAMAAATGYLMEHARDFGATVPRQALAELSTIHPIAARYYERYRQVWDAVRETAISQDLLTWPDFPIRYVPHPAWTRAAAPYLYFLSYRSPAAFDRPPVHDYLVTPVDETLPTSRQEELLRANNDSVIKLNHVIHHGSIGHHVQNWYAFRAPSRVGQIAAVDCASRIAMFCGGTMAEGWACYATDLMNEVGFLTPLEQYAEQQSRVRMCARAIVDVRLHQGRLTLEEAAEFYERNAGMGRDVARAEATKNSMFPGASLMYLMGRDAIHELRKELSMRQGKEFHLREFHDRFLAYGSIPVSLICKDMLAQDAGCDD